MAKNAGAKVGLATGVTLKNPVIPGFGKEPKVVAKAFSLEPESFSKPIEGNIGVYVIKTLKVKVAADIKNYTPYVEKLKKEREAGINQKIVEALKKKTEIDDKRDLIYQ
jgi:peptidyl-prolyl cis-trans isomerase D